MSRTFVVGLDGASWLLVEPWIQDGTLDTLRELRSNSTWATSQSCLPPVTYPNWKCYSSGKNPGKFGVYWFERIDLERGEISIMNRRDFKTAEIWDYLNEAGLRTGIVNMPTMYPPREIDGMIVCGGPDAVEGEYRSIESGFTYPQSLEHRLQTEFDYRVHPHPLLSSNKERGEEVEEILRRLESRFQVALELFEEDDLDFMHVTLFYLNVLQHFFWDEEPTRKAWMLIDEWLGKIRDLDDTNLIIMSDHGSAPTHTEFYINEWLNGNGYLKETHSVDDAFRNLGITRERALAAAKKFGLVEFLSQIVPEQIQKLIPQQTGAKRERKLEKIELSQTHALASGQGPIYLNSNLDDGQLAERLIKDLRTATNPEGKSLLEEAYRADEIYSGPYIDIGPEIILDQTIGVHINDGIGGGQVTGEPDRWAAENTRNGIFLASGPEIAARGRIDDVSILDIAPTILAGLGLDVPVDMDGQVLPIFDTQPTFGSRDPIPFEADEGDRYDAVADRLKQLGYME